MKKTPREKSSYERPLPNRSGIFRRLIVCEGACTEPNYIRGLAKASRYPSALLRVEGGKGSTVGVVEHAVALAEEMEKDDKKPDEVWCVFDMDDFPVEKLDKAITLARKHAYKIAFSNVCFEVWLILHFSYYDIAQSRNLYKSTLKKRMGKSYKKSDPNLFDAFSRHVGDAVRNAEKLAEQYATGDALHKRVPYTDFHKLAEVILSPPESRR